jgi:hypothetical protein
VIIPVLVSPLLMGRIGFAIHSPDVCILHHLEERWMQSAFDDGAWGAIAAFGQQPKALRRKGNAPDGTSWHLGC